MKRSAPWLILLALAAGVTLFYVKVIRDKQPEALAEPTQVVENSTNNSTAPPPAPEPPPAREPEPTPHGEKPAAAENPAPIGSTDIAAMYLTAIKQEQEGQVNNALATFRTIVEASPKSDEGIQAAARLGTYYCEQRESAKAIDYLKIALAGKLADEQRVKLRKMLDELSAEQILDPEANPRRVIYYTIKPGDNLSKIAAQYNITWRLIQRINGLTSTSIRVDEKLKIVKGPFDAVVEKNKYRLSVYLGSQYVKSYRVGLGKNDSTPVGNFKVESKLIEPDWIRPGKITKYGDPENQLGTRWIGFMKGYGIHGTWEPETIASQCSEGCVRMLNEEVEELFDLLVTGKSKVTIRK